MERVTRAGHVNGRHARITYILVHEREAGLIGI